MYESQIGSMSLVAQEKNKVSLHSILQPSFFHRLCKNVADQESAGHANCYNSKRKAARIWYKMFELKKVQVGLLEILSCLASSTAGRS